MLLLKQQYRKNKRYPRSKQRPIPGYTWAAIMKYNLCVTGQPLVSMSLVDWFDYKVKFFVQSPRP